MLEIKNIKKVYKLKDTKVEALKGVTMRFRKSEFVSILGPSGCGKTTLLNVVGGLDRYDSGDLIIDGVSTKNYKDKHWDNYRNHRIGFVFQSYNLIPHQTVLENVELALTLSGTKRSERKKRAIEVLTLVGLKDKLKSKPSQLSGGQMQRVAIARALVNNPEIILADEPTGALDSKTSVQIMELLKEVSKDRLVIMVTHNPELANEYSSRIIKLLDGELVEDSKPYSEEECKQDTEKRKQEQQKSIEEQQKVLQNKKLKQKKEKTSMSFFTALFLSFKNLLSKKGRTILVSLAGSIGIIGIALILAVSSGMMGYINNMQSQSLSSYPVSVLYMSVDTNQVMGAMMGGLNGEGGKTNNDNISVYDPLSQIEKMGNYNYIAPDFLNYVEDYYSNKNKKEYINDYQITYANDLRLIMKNDKFKSVIGTEYVPVNSSQTASAISGSINSNFFEELDKDYVLSMYNMLGEGAYYPEAENEVALVLNGNQTQNYTLFGLGLLPDLQTTKLNIKEDVLGKSYRLLLNNAYYDEQLHQPIVNFNDMFKGGLIDVNATTLNYFACASNLYNNANTKDLKITCVLQLKEDSAGSIFSDGIMYTRKLSKVYREDCKNSNIVKYINDLYFTQDEHGNKTFKNEMLNEPFDIKYSLDIAEIGADLFSFSSIAEMKAKLEEFKTHLCYEDIVEIYLQMFGASDIPLSVSFYVKSFEGRDDLVAMINSYNKTTDNKLIYSDTSQFLTNMLKNMVNIISYVLIAFAAISLIVSSIMISIITYTSVIERTKEIGVLRSVGASKKDVFWVFTAETVIIGLVAGVIGIGVAGLLSLLVSSILYVITGVGGLAILQPLSSIILILISVFLTFIAGLIPARIATKKDPVLALRSE